MNIQENQYLDLLSKLLEAPIKQDRTRTGTHSIFGHQMRFDLTQGFPLLTTKKVHFKSIVVELLWFLRGDTNIRYLLENGCTIWTEWRYKAYTDWANESHITREYRPKLTQKEFEQKIIEDDSFAAQWGDIGKGYGHQWRNFGEVTDNVEFGTGNPEIIQVQEGFDQISWLINEIKTNPDSRRLIVSSWNPHEVNQVDLPPCHTLFQFYVQDMTHLQRSVHFQKHFTSITDIPSEGTVEAWSELYDSVGVPKAKLSCQLYQRSCDTFLGLPFNITSYALLTHLIAYECDLDVGEFIWTGGDVHLYSNHIDQAKEQLTRTPYPFPKLGLDLKGKSIFDLEPSDISIVDYVSHPAIKAEVAV